jgi:Kef-type K+ transport system membrane component KefB
MHNSIFIELSALLVLCATIGMIMRALRQPLLIGYILTGLIVGPSLLGVVRTPETIEVLGSFGVALLLFIVGLGLNPKVIKEVGKVSLFAGLGQIIFTTGVGFILVHALGYDTTTSIYISLAMAFSSTIIILKLLSDKKEQHQLYGKIAIGLLLIQDIVASLALVAASASASGSLSVSALGWLFLKGALLVAGTVLFTQVVIKPLNTFLARSQELLFLFALAWGFGIATAFYLSGFSVEIGALLAGVCLAGMPYAQEVGSRLRPLRDFFVVVFFIALGARVNLGSLHNVIWQAVALSLFILVAKPIIVMIIMGVLGYTKKTSFKAGVVMGQISEFSIILLLLGAANHQIPEQAVSLITVVGIVTIALSSYFITYADGLYKFMQNYLPMFERRKVHPEQEKHKVYDSILFGYQRGGSEFIKVFERVSKRYIVIDYDPEAIDEMERKEIPYLYGDAGDLELLNEVNIDQAKLVVSVITEFETNVFILRQLEQHNPNAVMVCHADTVQQAIELYGLGASFVVMPHFIGNEKISAFIRKNGYKKTEFKNYRDKHLTYLQNHFDIPENEE